MRASKIEAARSLSGTRSNVGWIFRILGQAADQLGNGGANGDTEQDIPPPVDVPVPQERR